MLRKRLNILTFFLHLSITQRKKQKENINLYITYLNHHPKPIFFYFHIDYYPNHITKGKTMNPTSFII